MLLAGALALVVAGYVAASRRDVDGTTEVAAIVVLAAGVIAGTGRLGLASGMVAITSLLLVEKSRLHAFVRAIDDAGLRAGIRFAVMAMVILPLLPPGPYGPGDVVRPRQLWAIVLVFSGLSFAGWIAQRIVGTRRGYALAGLLGGIVSSTGVTLVLARASGTAQAAAGALACGAIAASTVMFARVVLVTAVLDRALAAAVAPHALVGFSVGTAVTLLLLRRTPAGRGALPRQKNPLQVGPALLMAVLFQAAHAAVSAAHAYGGRLGILGSSAVLGLTDVDALTFSMIQGSAAGVPETLAATALGLGMLANTLFKLALAVALGHGRFRGIAAAGLLAMAVALGVSLALGAPVLRG